LIAATEHSAAATANDAAAATRSAADVVATVPDTASQEVHAQPNDAVLADRSQALGTSPCWRLTLERARAVAKRSTTVLLRGESGTGKEVLAHLIHESSPRRDRPFVSLNCAALSETVLGSELFGHERGAFTGAMTRHKGRFELADGGTLFLDEIGEISGTFQASLLRVLQLGEFERVGGTSTIKVNVRLIAATNRNLEDEVRAGRFRSDLYYRLSVVPLRLPALSERASDIPLLAREFLRRFNVQNNTNMKLADSALAVLSAYPFPGNVRELENSICRAATLATTSLLAASDFAFLTTTEESQTVEPAVTADEGQVQEALSDMLGDEDAGARERLIAAMDRAGWVQAKAARMLGLTPRQVAYALQKYAIPVRKF
jgi:Nif-specific regulatory protein